LNESTFGGFSAGNATMSGVLNIGFGTQALSANTTGDFNSALGAEALLHNTAGASNTAIGAQTMFDTTTGAHNTAVGSFALEQNVEGSYNTAIGQSVLGQNRSSDNVAVGFSALEQSTTGVGNAVLGTLAMESNTTGSFNTAVGEFAGRNATSGSSNIYLGANVLGVAGESNTMYLGSVGTQTKTLIAGVRGITTGAADAVSVVIDSAGQLGTINSSRRYKEDTQDMGDASNELMKLRPVTYRYRQAYADGTKPIDYGLIAEEVEAVYPDLVAHLADGEVETVQYQKINAMLLNEVQKQHRTLEEQRSEIELLKARLTALERSNP